jgi:hypothetical protein
LADAPPFIPAGTVRLAAAGAPGVVVGAVTLSPYTSTVVGPKTALDVAIIAGGGGTIGTADQGAAGTDPWPVLAAQDGAWAVSITGPISGPLTVDQGAPGASPWLVDIGVSTLTVDQGTSPWVVDGSGVTQPISAAALPLPTGAATEATLAAILAGPLDVTGSTVAVSGTVAVTQSGAWTATVSGTVTTTPPANASTNVTQWAGTAVDTNSGNKSAGTLRVTLATDQVQLTNALKVDGSAVTQPVSGTVTANAGTGTFTIAGAVTNTVLSVVGGGTEATAQRVTIANDSTGLLSVDDNGGSLTVDGTVTANAGTGTFTIAGAVTNTVLSVDDNGGSLTVDGTVTANAGTGTFTIAGAVTNTVLSVVGGGTEATAQRVTIANDSTGLLSVDDNGGSLTVDGTVAATQSGTWNIGTVTTVTAVTAISNALPAGNNNIGDVDVASVAGTVTTKELRAATPTVTTVADTASSTTLLASNANRLGATIANDSSAVLYVKFGTTASATDYTARLVRYAYLEVPFNYTGRIDGIWATDPGDGAARITELAA